MKVKYMNVFLELVFVKIGFFNKNARKQIMDSGLFGFQRLVLSTVLDTSLKYDTRTEIELELTTIFPKYYCHYNSNDEYNNLYKSIIIITVH